MSVSAETLGKITGFVAGPHFREVRWRVLDCCCGGGGMSKGLEIAGFEVTGCDIVHHACYPYPLILKDFRRLTYEDLANYDYIHLSPPCQQYSRGSAVARKRGKTYPDLYEAARRLAIVSGLPYTIENVPGSPAKGVRLYGDMFGLPILRERIFESNLHLVSHLPRHKPDRIITVAGSGPRNGDNWRKAMGIDWKMPNEIVKECVPPPMAAFIGRQVLMWLEDNRRLNYEKLPDYEIREEYEE